MYQFKANSTNLTINDLHPHYTYHVVVSAFTIALGPQTISQNVTTLEDGMHTMNSTCDIMLFVLFCNSALWPT